MKTFPLRGWMPPSTKVQKICNECVDIAKKCGFEVPQFGLYTNKMTSALGRAHRCFAQRAIVISKYAIEGGANIKNIILHEIGHLIASPGEGHGYEWKQIVNKLGRVANERISRLASTEQSKLFRAAFPQKSGYVLQKECCGTQGFFRRIKGNYLTFDTIGVARVFASESLAKDYITSHVREEHRKHFKIVFKGDVL